MGKVISLVEKEKKRCADKVLDIINILEEYDIAIEISRPDIILILSELYDLYLEKKIAYQYASLF